VLRRWAVFVNRFTLEATDRGGRADHIWHPPTVGPDARGAPPLDRSTKSSRATGPAKA